MTKERMIELIEIEHECMRRGAHSECDRDCANCELVQDDRDLDEMYTGVIAILKNQEAVVPGLAQTSDGIYASCGNCKTNLWKIMGIEFTVSPDDMPRFCPKCGREVKWK